MNTTNTLSRTACFFAFTLALLLTTACGSDNFTHREAGLGGAAGGEPTAPDMGGAPPVVDPTCERAELAPAWSCVDASESTVTCIMVAPNGFEYPVCFSPSANACVDTEGLRGCRRL